MDTRPGLCPGIPVLSILFGEQGPGVINEFKMSVPLNMEYDMSMLSVVSYVPGFFDQVYLLDVKDCSPFGRGL
jgi:hypothetical protein